MSPILVSGSFFIAREEYFEAYSLHEGPSLYCNKSLIHYMKATYHPFLCLGPYSLRERNNSKPIRYMRDLAFIVTEASSIIWGQHIIHYCIWGLIHCARWTFRSLFVTEPRPLYEGNISPIIVFGAVIIAREEHFEAYSLHEGLGLYCNKSRIRYMKAT